MKKRRKVKEKYGRVPRQAMMKKRGKLEAVAKQAQLKGTKDAKEEIQATLAIAEAGVKALNEEVADWRDHVTQLQATLAARIKQRDAAVQEAGRLLARIRELNLDLELEA